MSLSPMLELFVGSDSQQVDEMIKFAVDRNLSPQDKVWTAIQESQQIRGICQDLALKIEQMKQASDLEVAVLREKILPLEKELRQNSLQGTTIKKDPLKKPLFWHSLLEY